MIAAFVSLCMVLTMLPSMAFAEDVDLQDSGMTLGVSGQPAEGIQTDEGGCICAALCTEGNVNADCPVCSAAGADLSACLGEAPASASLLGARSALDQSITVGSEILTTSAETPSSIG